MTLPGPASAPRRKPAHTARRVAVVLSATAFAGIATTLAVVNHAAAGTASPANATPSDAAVPDQFNGFDSQPDDQFVPPQSNDQFDPFADQGAATPAPFQPAAPPLTNSGGS